MAPRVTIDHPISSSIRRALDNLWDYDSSSADVAALGFRATEQMRAARETCDPRMMMDAIYRAMDACQLVESARDNYERRGLSVPNFAIESATALATALREEIEDAQVDFDEGCMCHRSHRR